MASIVQPGAEDKGPVDPSVFSRACAPSAKKDRSEVLFEGAWQDLPACLENVKLLDSGLGAALPTLLDPETFPVPAPGTRVGLSIVALSPGGHALRALSLRTGQQKRVWNLLVAGCPWEAGDGAPPPGQSAWCDESGACLGDHPPGLPFDASLLADSGSLRLSMFRWPVRRLRFLFNRPVEARAIAPGRVVQQSLRGPENASVTVSHADGVLVHYSRLGRVRNGLRLDARLEAGETIGYAEAAPGDSLATRFDVRVERWGQVIDPEVFFGKALPAPAEEAP